MLSPRLLALLCFGGPPSLPMLMVIEQLLFSLSNVVVHSWTVGIRYIADAGNSWDDWMAGRGYDL